MARDGEQGKPEPGKLGGKPAKGKGWLSEKARRARAAARRRGKQGGQRRVNLIWAIVHPVRRRILRLLHDLNEPLSPAEAAAELGLPKAMVAYHARVLERFGAVEPARQPADGSVDGLYDSTIEDDPPIEALLEETREVDDEEGSTGRTSRR
jgi:DNA-binding transcriptional ArsR family regulator